jgi:AGCS family alanine or glycine:cation symporter
MPMDLPHLLVVRDWLVGWPLMLYVVAMSIMCTIVLKGVQLRLFGKAWRMLASGGEGEKTVKDMTPLQAFINTLSTNLGNGSIAGMATAVYAGGPGSALWVVIFGILMMAVRFAEVYISTIYGERAQKSTVLGGPMLYLRDVPAGKILSYCYAFFCFLNGLIIGNMVQSNSIQLSLSSTFGWSVYSIAFVLTAFVLYITCGGSQRIIAASDRIVPVKVLVFVLATCALLMYHYRSLVDAFLLIGSSAFGFGSFKGGLIGFSVQQAIQFGMARSILATESGLGSAAILFGFTGSRDPLGSGLMGMMSTFISTCVCFIVALCIIASGVWSSGLTSTALTVAAFKTVFGGWGGWIVSFLSITFGVGVTVSYAYITRASWLCLTNGKYDYMFILFYVLCCFFGAIANVDIVWALGDFVAAGMLFINLFGIAYILLTKQVTLKES